MTLTEIATKLRELATTLDGALDTSRMCYAIGAASSELEHIAADLDRAQAERVKVPQTISGGIYATAYPDGWNACIAEVKKLNGVET